MTRYDILSDFKPQNKCNYAKNIVILISDAYTKTKLETDTENQFSLYIQPSFLSSLCISAFDSLTIK